MTRARLKTETCDAWQFKLPSWARFEMREDGLYLVRASGKQRIERGEWLVRDLDGEPSWLTDAEFQRDYETVSTHEGSKE